MHELILEAIEGYNHRFLVGDGVQFHYRASDKGGSVITYGGNLYEVRPTPAEIAAKIEEARRRDAINAHAAQLRATIIYRDNGADPSRLSFDQCYREAAELYDAGTAFFAAGEGREP